MKSAIILCLFASCFLILCSAVPIPDDPYYDLDPNTADLTEPEGELFGPMMGFIRRTRSAYADYIQNAAASFRKIVYRPFQMMGINRHNLRVHGGDIDLKSDTRKYFAAMQNVRKVQRCKGCPFKATAKHCNFSACDHVCWNYTMSIW